MSLVSLLCEIAVVGAALLLLAIPGGAQEGLQTVRPEDTGEALCNPGMGWVFHYYDNQPGNYGSRLAPSDTLDDFPGLTVIYLRIPWSYLEPEEGKFNWSVLDTPAQRWIAKGKQVAFRFSCSESWTRWATPEWVQKAGARGYEFIPGRGIVEAPEKGTLWEPDYNDPIFLEKLDHFLAAAAQRYDGNPEVAFIDVGSFGVWGEGHTYSSTKLPYSAETVRRHIDLHKKHFKRTLLAANDDFASQGRGVEVIDYAREQGLTLRDDSILVQAGKNAYFHAAFAQGIWERLPVILESEHYGGSRDRGAWGDGHLYLQAVEDYHASYASIHWWPREFLEEQRELIHQINQRLGYRLQLREATWPAHLRLGDRLTFATRWRNAGVAPCLPGGFPAVTLKDDRGGIVGVFVDETFDMAKLPVGAPGQAAELAQSADFALPFQLRAGTYDVFISVGTRTGTPTIALPLAGNDGQRRYKLGSLQIRGDFDVQAGALEPAGDAWRLPLTWTVHEDLPAGVRPFVHFEQGGKIVFQGLPEGPAPEGWGKEGTCRWDATFTLPTDARAKSYDVRVGLWFPERIGRPDERLQPDRDLGDRRTRLGTLQVAEDGSAAIREGK
jgi:hypothetical protein